MTITQAQNHIKYNNGDKGTSVHITRSQRIIDTTPSVARWNAMKKNIENNH